MSISSTNSSSDEESPLLWRIKYYSRPHFESVPENADAEGPVAEADKELSTLSLLLIMGSMWLGVFIASVGVWLRSMLWKARVSVKNKTNASLFRYYTHREPARPHIYHFPFIPILLLARLSVLHRERRGRGLWQGYTNVFYLLGPYPELCSAASSIMCGPGVQPS